MSIQIITLIVVCGFLTMIGTVLAKLILGQGTWSEAVWWTWLRITSTNYLGQDSGTIPRMVSTLVILAGWLIFGLLISLLSTAVQARLALLKRGITHVLCTNHAVVMGWGSTIYSVLDELFAGDEPVSRNVVVLADRD